MPVENKGRILIVGSTLHVTLYDSILRHNGHETYTVALEDKEGAILHNHAERIVKLIQDCQPALIVIHDDSYADEFLTKMEEAFRGSKRPAVIVLAPRDLWSVKADVCLSSPPHPEVLLRTVQELLQTDSQ